MPEPDLLVSAFSWTLDTIQNMSPRGLEHLTGEYESQDLHSVSCLVTLGRTLDLFQLWFSHLHNEMYSTRSSLRFPQGLKILEIFLWNPVPPRPNILTAGKHRCRAHPPHSVISWGRLLQKVKHFPSYTFGLTSWKKRADFKDTLREKMYVAEGSIAKFLSFKTNQRYGITP